MQTINPSEITVAVMSPPFSHRGFRSGHWTVTYRGQKSRVFASIPSCLEIPEQISRVRAAAARALQANF